MAIVKIRTNQQITIPKRIFEELGLLEGDFIQPDSRRGLADRPGAQTPGGLGGCP